jgi:hypothetical protein
MRNFRNCSATYLSEVDVAKIIEAHNKVPYAAMKMAKEFHISARRVYEIWRIDGEIQQQIATDQLTTSTTDTSATDTSANEQMAMLRRQRDMLLRR